MATEIKNNTSQPLLIVVGKETVQVNARQTIVVDEKAIGEQIRNLQARKLVKIVKR